MEDSCADLPSSQQCQAALGISEPIDCGCDILARLFEVRKTMDKGFGLFAKQPVPTGTMVFYECQNCKRISNDGFESTITDEQRSCVLA